MHTGLNSQDLGISTIAISAVNWLDKKDVENNVFIKTSEAFAINNAEK